MISAAPSRSSIKQFLGKYRGTVVNNLDPKGMGRIQVLVPDVAPTSISSWAMPCFPWGGGLTQSGMFSVPQVGTGVWVEFEQGDQDFPIWTGCFVGSGTEIPADAKATMGGPVSGITLQTTLRNMIQVSDLPGPTGGIQLRTTTGAMISVTDVGITITNGKGATITMLGNTVDVNGGALTVI